MAQNIGVVMGGWGEEREISLQTGEAVIQALRARGHRPIGILAGPRLDLTLRTVDIDVAFLALHGRMGEDGRVQGLLEVLGIPYTGSGVLASALAMDKAVAKQLFRLHNLETPPGYTVNTDELPSLLQRHGNLGFPCVVKPARGGSSVGLTRVGSASGLKDACLLALQYGGTALVERFLPGREVTVGLLDGQVLGSCEIDPGGDTLDFAHKYQTGSQYHLPPRLTETRRCNVETLALAAYRALGCRGHARVDLRVSDEGNEGLLEVNTLPGLTPVSLLPKIAARAGLPFPELVEGILRSARCDDASAHWVAAPVRAVG